MNFFEMMRNAAVVERSKHGTYGSLNESIDKMDQKNVWNLKGEEAEEYDELKRTDKNRLLGIFEKPTKKRMVINETLNPQGVNIDKPTQVL